MLPVKRDSHNFTYKGPTPEIGDLSCERRDGAVLSHWRPSGDELKVLNEGGVIELSIFTEPIPPVSIAVAGREWLSAESLELMREEAKTDHQTRMSLEEIEDEMRTAGVDPDAR